MSSKGRGRPSIDANDRRDTVVTTRLTEQESLLLEKFAWAEGITTSTAIRWIMCGCLSDSSARAEAIEAGNMWIDSDGGGNISKDALQCMHRAGNSKSQSSQLPQ